MATRYVLVRPGIEFFRTLPDRPWGLQSPLYNECRDVPGGKVAGPDWAVPLTTHPLLIIRLKKSRAIPLITLCALMTGYGVKLMFYVPVYDVLQALMGGTLNLEDILLVLSHVLRCTDRINYVFSFLCISSHLTLSMNVHSWKGATSSQVSVNTG